MLLDGGAIADFAALVIHNELAGIAQGMSRGIEINPDTLAVRLSRRSELVLAEITCQ